MPKSPKAETTFPQNKDTSFPKRGHKLPKQGRNNSKTASKEVAQKRGRPTCQSIRGVERRAPGVELKVRSVECEVQSAEF